MIVSRLGNGMMDIRCKQLRYPILLAERLAADESLGN